MVWRTLFPLFFLFSLVDGFISTILYPAKLPLLYKDFFLILVYFFFLINEHVGHWIQGLREQIGTMPYFFAMMFMVVGLLQIFNPLSPGLVLGLLGFKVAFFYWPLALLAYVYADQPAKVLRFLKIIAYASLAINAFGLYQFAKGPEFLISQFGPGFERVVFMAHLDPSADPALKSFFRVVGTFASTGQYSSFLTANAMFCFVLVFLTRTKLERGLFLGCQVLNFLALLATGSRGSLVVLVLQLMIFSFGSRRARPILAATLIAGLSLYFGFTWLGKGVVKRYESLREVEMIRERTLETTAQMFLHHLDRFPMGRGLGAGSTAARHLQTQDPLLRWMLVENYLSKLQLEFGITGVILFYVFSIALLMRMRNWLKWVDEASFEMTLALASYCFVQFTFGSLFSVLDVPPTSVFLWTTVGFVARLSSFQRKPAGTEPIRIGI